ncbi:YlbF family regulator [Halalkalibacterium ligniniphilum]|uniref:YlbF family regulator n=1 Tax=Halalkalibacterium ligniniphilum TaxID=1134413 RepID=UPI00034D0C99|nr:YlbF family regulator [Halalkalibacterium ligniniphilum]
MSTVYDKAHELKQAISESEEFIALKALHEQIEADDIAKRLLDNFRQLQLDLQQKQMQGIQITEEEAQKAQQQFELVQQHELISKLMEAEQRLSVIIGDLNRIITEPLEAIYGSPNEQQ